MTYAEAIVLRVVANAECQDIFPVGVRLSRGELMTAAAAAILIRRERELVDTFRTAGATSPEKAVSLSDLNIVGQSVALKRLQRDAVLRETASGLFYLDEPSWTALRGIRRRIVIVMLVVVVAVLLLALIGRRVF
jgi:hypothetical protein